jgi:YegS/Rv2252/BmrU family lipid kinase
MRLRLIVNPKAGAGSAKRRIPEISAALRKVGLEHDVAETQAPGDAKRLLELARREAVDCVAIVGGDGTLNEVSQAYVAADGTPLPGPDLALIPAGTGGDFRKTFGLGLDVEEAAQRLKQSEPRPLDLGILELEDHDGKRVVRAFLNITSFGIGGLTDRIVNATPKWMGGKAAFFVGSLRAMFVYQNAPVRVSVDGRTLVDGPIFNVAVANGRFFGGGMKIAPEADPSDGQFDVVALGDFSRAGAVALSSHIYKGTHIGRDLVTTGRGARIDAEPLRKGDEVLIDMDGETPGRLPLTARVAPSALRIRA